MNFVSIYAISRSLAVELSKSLLHSDKEYLLSANRVFRQMFPGPKYIEESKISSNCEKRTIQNWLSEPKKWF
jgi:hypothetical protein